MGLVATMEKALEYVRTFDASETLKKALEDYIEATLRQIVECALFIREYCQAGFIGQFRRGIVY